MSTVHLDARVLRPAQLLPPVSKSDAQRAQVLARMIQLPAFAALTDPPAALPADVRTMARGLAALDAAGGIPVEIDCADGGAPLRLLVGQAAVAPYGTFRFSGTKRLGERPHGPLLSALAATLTPHGTRLQHEGFWPLVVTASGRTGEPCFRIDGGQSSQFVSSLLLAAAALCLREGRPWAVERLGKTASEGYLALTLEWLKRAGFEVREEGPFLRIEGHRAPTRVDPVPGDWSSLGYLLAISWRAGGSVGRADLSAAHPDQEVLALLRQVGLSVDEVGPRQLKVEGIARTGLLASASSCPDLIPTLAALACVLPAPSTFTEVEILRAKESDRLEGVCALVRAAGGKATLSPEGALVVTPPSQVRAGFAVDSRGDHRMVMAAATLAALATTGAEVTDPDCVEKSFPAFWSELGRAGVSCSRP